MESSRYHDVLKRITLFSDLEKDQIDALAQVAKSRVYPKGSIIIYEGDTGDALLYLIIEGRAKVTLISDEGREIILATLKTGDFFGEMSLLDGAPRSATIVAMEDTRLLVLYREDFLAKLVEHPSVSMKIFQALTARLRAANHKIGSLALLDVYGRVANTIYQMAKTEGRRLGNNRLCFSRPTQQEIANMVGTSREVVQRVMKDLGQRGYITVAGKEIIVHEADLAEEGTFWVQSG